ncbi:MAG: hypothetical protein SGI91_08395 [Alphaproteobacteria bacterium]|nr:hypothetical protein [Alphaproteobacteria bacterium]
MRDGHDASDFLNSHADANHIEAKTKTSEIAVQWKTIAPPPNYDGPDPG